MNILKSLFFNILAKAKGQDKSLTIEENNNFIDINKILKPSNGIFMDGYGWTISIKFGDEGLPVDVYFVGWLYNDEFGLTHERPNLETLNSIRIHVNSWWDDFLAKLSEADLKISVGLREETIRFKVA